jgi:hypothetical protein
LRRVVDQLGIHIATIGHTGKDEGRGERGSNAKLADVDLQVQISGDDIKSVTVTKANDQDHGELTNFKLEPYELGLDEDGDPIRTFILGRDVPASAATASKELSPKQRLAMDALLEVLLKQGQPAPTDYGLPSGTSVVAAEAWKTEMLRRNILDPDKNPHARYNDIRDGMKVKAIIGSRDKVVWVATKVGP